MPWLESHTDLEDHPKVAELGGHMGWTLDTTLGKLHRFWWWCLRFAPTGDLHRFADSVIAKGVGLNANDGKRFVDAMVKSRWIDRDNVVFRVHDWPVYAGRYLKTSKFKRQPEKWAETMAVYGLSVDSPQTVLELSPHQPTNQPTYTHTGGASAKKEALKRKIREGSQP